MVKTHLAILILAIPGVALGSVSANVPLSHWSYADVDRLIGLGLIQSGMMCTRPVSRLEMARLVEEAMSSTKPGNSTVVDAMLHRLGLEFRQELGFAHDLYTSGSSHHVKPIEDPYVRWVSCTQPFDPQNQSGDLFDQGSNLRIGFASRATLWDRFCFYIHPEYRSPSAGSGFNTVEAYAKTRVGFLEVEVGKDSLWWGPGYRGSMIMSNNAENLAMLKVSNPQPIFLPWALKGLGPFKAVYFLTQLEDMREHPGTKLTGVRLSVKPRPWLEIGGSRTIQFGGKGVPSIGLRDYLEIFWPKNYQGFENQFGSLDLSVLVPLPEQRLAKSIKGYLDWAGEDAAGFHLYEPLIGVQIFDLLRTGRTDLRIEYSENNPTFYVHSVYTDGYTYKDRIIGHAVGTDSRDLLVRLTHDLTGDLRLGLQYGHQRHRLTGSPKPGADQYSVDLTWFGPGPWEMRAAYRFEQGFSDDVWMGRNHIVDLGLVYNY